MEVIEINIYDGIHWNIYQILPYQRNFNLINSERSIGKTYTTLFYVLDKCIDRGEEFIYLVRTKDEKKNGALEDAFKKVIAQQFGRHKFKFTADDMSLQIEDSEGELIENVQLGYCIALSESVKVKRNSYPNVKYMIFDEYIIGDDSKDNYVNGWKEPDLLLNIYHTADREEDRIICFMLANNIKFNNPYHIHKAFRIPRISKGQIWTSENVLFQYAEGSAQLKEKKAKSKFIRMLEGTEYGNYAVGGEYVFDNYAFIAPLKSTARYTMTLEYEGQSFGIYSDYKEGLIYISDKIDPSCKLVYALTLSDHRENTMLTRGGRPTQLKWLAENYKLSNVRFTSMPVKVKIENGLVLIL